MTQYEDSLIALKRLLDSAGAKAWGQWIATDIELWRSKRVTSHHLSAFDGNGSLNDFVICPGKDAVNESNEAWANTLFQWLYLLCYFLAKHPADFFTANTLRERVTAMYGSWNDTGTLNGWRCCECGRSEAFPGAIEYVMTTDLIPKVLFESCEKRELEDLVDQTLAVDFPGIVETRSALNEAAAANGILLRNRKFWNWTCPYCRSSNTAAYRWNLVNENGLRFEPSSDNLPPR